MTLREKEKISDDAMFLLFGAVIRDALLDLNIDIQRRVEQMRDAYTKRDKGKISNYHLSTIESKRALMQKNKEDAKCFFQNNAIFKGNYINLEYLQNKKDLLLGGREI